MCFSVAPDLMFIVILLLRVVDVIPMYTLRSEEAYSVLEDMKISKVHWSDADYLVFLWNCSS